jgi:hypothetical protein
MSTTVSHWHKEDLFVYALLFCANADLEESIYEEAEIKAKYPTANYDLIHQEFMADNDATRAEKILECARAHNMTKGDFDELFEFIPTILKADGHVSAEEQMMLHGLQELLNALQ